MAKYPSKSNTDKLVDQMIDDTDAAAEPDEQAAYEPTYRVVGDSTKIPVSKATGKLWKARRDQSIAYVEQLGVRKSWDEAISYYKNDQSSSKDSDRDPTRENRSSARTFSRKHSSTENVVFANVSALVPATYAKNPDVEVTAVEKKELEPFCTTCERLINILISRKVAPGVNLKPKMRRGVVMTTLTNISFFEVGYIKKANSSEQALEDLRLEAEKLSKAKDAKEIQEIEGCLRALESKVDILEPSGPFVKFKDMRDVLVDPNSVLPDFSDSSYYLIRDMVPTEMLRALYGKKNDRGEWTTLFEPSHVMKTKMSGADGVDAELTFDPFNAGKGKSFRDYGYEDEETFKYSQHTCVWYAWDLATRRVLLFNDADWTWPLWVWDDPYQFDTFHPLVPLAYYTDPEISYARSEVMYYLDQQDEINKINSEIKRAREFVTGKFIYNRKVLSGEIVEKILDGTTDRRVIGIDAEPDFDLKKALIGVELPSLNNPELFDKNMQLEAVNRLSSVGTVMRNQEYKTNTTNRAIESYESQNQTRLDEKVDAVEDAIGTIGWKILQLCIRNMSAEEVGELIGAEHIEIWNQYARPENLRYMTLSVVGGSALKPTARAKKEEAVQIGQVVGQFADAAPAAVLVMLRMMERAFDELTITEEDWKLISESIQAQMEKGRAEGAAAQQAQQEPPPEGEQDAKVGQVLAQLDQIMAKLPPEIKQQFGAAIAQGGKPSEIVRQLLDKHA